MTNLTPEEHQSVLADAWLMYARWLANPYAPITARTTPPPHVPHDPGPKPRPGSVAALKARYRRWYA